MRLEGLRHHQMNAEVPRIAHQDQFGLDERFEMVPLEHQLFEL